MFLSIHPPTLSVMKMGKKSDAAPMNPIPPLNRSARISMEREAQSYLSGYTRALCRERHRKHWRDRWGHKTEAWLWLPKPFEKKIDES